MVKGKSHIYDGKFFDWKLFDTCVTSHIGRYISSYLSSKRDPGKDSLLKKKVMCTSAPCPSSDMNKTIIIDFDIVINLTSMQSMDVT